MAIEIYNKTTGNMQPVESWPTATRHFEITKPLRSPDETIDLGEFFIVTHVRSTAIALGPFRNVEVARLCAAIMGYLPMPWDDFPMTVCEEYREADAAQAERFKAAWAALPDEIRKWRQEVNNACAMGEL